MQLVGHGVNVVQDISDKDSYFPQISVIWIFNLPNYKNEYGLMVN